MPIYNAWAYRASGLPGMLRCVHAFMLQCEVQGPAVLALNCLMATACLMLPDATCAKQAAAAGWIIARRDRWPMHCMLDFFCVQHAFQVPVKSHTAVPWAETKKDELLSQMIALSARTIHHSAAWCWGQAGPITHEVLV